MTGRKSDHYLKLTGSPYARGLTHGKEYKEKIQELVEIWRGNIQNQFKTTPEAYISRFLENTDYLPAIKKYTPDLIEEVTGIADGCEVDFDTMFAFQLLDEFLLNSADIKAEHCSTIGVNRTDQQPAMLAQNWDILGYIKGFQVLLHIVHEDSDLEAFVFTYVGFIAALGMNNKGVGIGVNSIGELSYAASGLPISFFIRGVLEQDSQADAIKFLKTVEHASPQNYLIGGPDSIFDFECSSSKIVPFEVSPNSRVVYHTNHAFSNDDVRQDHLDEMAKKEPEEIENDNSRTRFRALEQRFGVKKTTYTIEDVKAALSSHDSDEHPICMSYKDEISLYSMGSAVMVFNEKPEFHLSFGPPDVNPYEVFVFDS